MYACDLTGWISESISYFPGGSWNERGVCRGNVGRHLFGQEKVKQSGINTTFAIFCENSYAAKDFEIGANFTTFLGIFEPTKVV